ncbi:hypothetical protein [Undibacterium umbellatum]|uniref:Uncharacterized protein n=1 Tax=Undibacterium umbellatum TaxID=2762300 RepID=A0ABR6Z8M5_9BURK|nr:hypothetical protein [Undibacterium umbellatum]MBC3907964.1 hypothetical protein [Undibacterium umbellatum]
MIEKNASMSEQNILLDNMPESISKLVIEPWAEEIAIEQGDKVNVVGFGPIANARLQLEFKNNSLIIYAWQGSTLTVRLNERTVETASKVIEAI